MWAANVPAANLHGNWSFASDSTAAGGTALLNTNNNAAKTSPPLASPTNYFEQTFTADAGKAYHLWIRMRATSNSLSNDSVSVQFSDSVDGNGNATMRIGSAGGAEIVLQNGSSDPSVNNWGWADANWNGPAAPVFFAASGAHTVRVQQREDGPLIDQIVLSPDAFLSTPPGPRDNDSTILTSTDDTSGGGGGGGGTGQGASIVMWAANVPAANLQGNWSFASDSTAAGGTALLNTNNNAAKTSPPLASPANYVEQTFTADAGMPYHLWIRMRATSNSMSNDSVSIQFNDSVDASGNPSMQIGSTSGAEIVLQNGSSDSSINNWGWADANWNGPAAPVYFAASGTHTVRIQQREDGPLVDQIVLSPDAFLTTAPGPRDNDSTILTSTDGTSGGGGGTDAGASVVLWAAHVPAADLHGNWSFASDATAAGDSALLNANDNAAKNSPPLADPTSYFERTFTADAGTPYHLWVRMRATNNSMSNDSVSVQFNDSVDASGDPSLQIGSASGAEIVLQNGPSDSSISNWGWADANWNGPAAPVYFATTGTHTVRIQQREDGPLVDQIVLSPDAFLTAAPGPRDNDATVLAEDDGS